MIKTLATRKLEMTLRLRGWKRDGILWVPDPERNLIRPRERKSQWRKKILKEFMRG